MYYPVKKFLTLLTVSISLIACSFGLSSMAIAQSCCTPSNKSLATPAYYSDPKFMSAHLSPLPFTFIAKSGKMVTFKTDDGKTASAFLVPSPKASNKYLIMSHEWWGLNDYIKQEAERYREALGNVNVLALDLFDGKVATTPEEASKITRGADPERLRAIVRGAVDYAGNKAQIGTVGWCFGGTWSLETALAAGKQGKACVIYYGMPEMRASRLEALGGPVLGIFASRDEYITPAKVEEFAAAMKSAERKLEVKSYDAVHAFANPSNPKYNKEAASDAYKRTIAFLKKHLMK